MLSQTFWGVFDITVGGKIDKTCMTIHFLGRHKILSRTDTVILNMNIVMENRFLTGALAILRGSAPKVFLDIGGIHTLDYPLVIKRRNGQSTICS